MCHHSRCDVVIEPFDDGGMDDAEPDCNQESSQGQPRYEEYEDPYRTVLWHNTHGGILSDCSSARFVPVVSG